MLIMEVPRRVRKGPTGLEGAMPDRRRNVWEEVSRPQPYAPDGHRYTSLALPPYRHLPGRTPHPQRDPRGHQYGQESQPRPLDPGRWQDSTEYLFGVDLFNFAYFWEAHESWEGLWKMTGRRDTPGKFLQGLIQISAALLKREQGVERGMAKLAAEGLAKLSQVSRQHSFYCGIELPEFCGRIRRIVAAGSTPGWPADPRIHLQME